MKRKLKRVSVETSSVALVKAEQKNEVEKIESWDNEEDEDESDGDDSKMSEDERFILDKVASGGGNSQPRGAPDAKKPRLIKANLYKPPTNEELQELKETETLFQSSLFRMQITELLNEVKLKEKHKKQGQEFVAKLQEILLNLPNKDERDMTNQKQFQKFNVKVPFVQHPFNVKGKFKFLPPKSVQVIGSSSVGSVCRPDSNIDLAVEMPKECFQAKDNMNQRYLRKKALYLASLVVQLMNCPLVDEMLYSHHHCGHLSPILVIKPKGKLGKHTSVHLHLYPESGSFKLNRFHIAKSNIRRQWFLEKEEEEDHGSEAAEEPTPYYNTAVLSDITRVEVSETLHSCLENASGLVDGLILLKVWLRQRELNAVHGGFSNLLMTAFVVYLQKKRKLSILMSSYQVLRTVLFHLSQANWDSLGMSLCDDSTDPNRPGMEEFHKYFDIVFLDPTGYLNLAAFVSMEMFERVKHEAEVSVNQLETLGTDGFEALFMNPCPFIRKFDQVFHFTELSKLRNCVTPHNLEDRLRDLGGDYVQTCIPVFLRLLKQGLGNRVTIMQVQSSRLKTWHCSEEAPKFGHLEKMTLGLLLDPEHASDIIIKGPPADSAEAKMFRQFWGEKSELRRFQDGSILEAVVWQAQTLSERRSVTSRIIKHIIKIHFKMEGSAVKFVSPRLDPLLQIYHNPKKKKLEYGTGEEQHIVLLKVYDDLAKQLRNLKDLPLTIHSIQATASALRYSQVFPPLRPLEDEPVRIEGKRQMPQADQPCPLFNQSLAVQCVLEQSGKWPDNLEAVKRLKAAFHVTLSQCLREQCGLFALPYPTHVTVLKNDLVFNIEIVYLKEIGLLREEMSPDGMVKMVDKEEAKNLEKRVVLEPKMASAIRGVQSVHNSFCSAARLFKRWVSAQMLADYITDEVLELIAAHVFLHPAPFTPPSSPLAGFLRMLHLLASFDWKLAPLIVNLNQELTKADYTEIHSHFTKHRATLPLMFIACPYDKLKSVWTKGHCPAPILQRLTLLAKESLDLLETQLNSVQSDVDFKQAFRPPLDAYDVLIHLKTLQISKCHQAVDVDTDVPPPVYFPIDWEKKETLSSLVPVVDYDPPARYLEELRDAYGDLAMFFYDPLGGGVVGVLWKPGISEPQDFKVAHVNARMPKLNDKAVQLVPNTDAILEDFKLIGQGLVKQIVVKDQ